MGDEPGAFFPPLEKCLQMDQFVISWKHWADAVTDVQLNDQQTPLFDTYTSDPHVLEHVKDPIKSWAKPNDATRKAYDARIASIPSSSGIDVAQIKADATWLSANANLNLETALRIVVVEYQSRATSQLTGGLSAQEMLNLQEASGGTDTLSTTIAATLRAQESLDAEDLAAQFEKEDARRKRIFQTFLAERRFYAVTTDAFHSNILYGVLPYYAADVANREAYAAPEDKTKVKTATRIIDKYLEWLSISMDAATSYISSLSDDPILNTEEMANDYQGTVFTEMAHAISVIFRALQYVDMEYEDGYLMEPRLVTHWFALMSKGAFLEVPEDEFPVPSLYAPLTTLVCATSLLFLKPTRAMSILTHDAELHVGEVAYSSSPETLEQIHAAIVSAFDGCVVKISPVVFVWTILLHHMHLSYVERNDKRDTIQQQRSAELLEDGVTRPTGRRSSIGSIVSLETTSYDSFLVAVGVEKDMQLVELMAQQATQNGIAFNVVQRMCEVAGCGPDAAFSVMHGVRIRSVFAGFVTFTYGMVSYQSDNVQAMLAAVNGNSNYWTEPMDPLLSSKYDATQFILGSEAGQQCFLAEAVNRYPLEFVPFLKFCKALLREKPEGPREQSQRNKNDAAVVSTVLSILEETPRVTFRLPADYQDYELVYPDENTNSIQLLEPLPIIGAASRSRFGDAGVGFVIPAGTYGRFISDTERLAFVDYPHSALQLMGRRLQINYCRAGFELLLGPMDEEEVAESISLLATLLRAEQARTAISSNRPQTQAYNMSPICDEASAAMEGDRDILTVVCDIMDIYLQDDTVFSCDEVPPILSACVEFLHATIGVYPSRVLSYLARCTLLPYQADGGKLGRLAGNLDISSGQFDFVLSTMRLFNTAVETVTRSAVYRKAGTKRITRDQGNPDVWLGTADKVLVRVVGAIAQGSIDVLETSPTWKFPSGLNASLLIDAVVGTLSTILHNAYGIGDLDLPSRITATLEPAGQYILQSFLSPSAGSLKMQPLLDTLTSAMTFPMATFYTAEFEQMRRRVETVLGFHTTLLRCAALHSMDSGALQGLLFKISFMFARLSATRSAFRRPCLSILQALVTAAGRDSEEPPSLLGFFGAAAAKSFLDLLRNFSVFDNAADNIPVWNFLTAVIRNKQQWMSNCLISGQTPREGSKSKPSSEDAAKLAAKTEVSKGPTSVSVFHKALGMLKTRMPNMTDAEVDALLEFTTAAQNYWPWTVFTIMKDPEALDSLRAHVRGLKTAAVTCKSKQPGATIKAAFAAKRAAYIAEAFAMQLYHLRHMKQAKPLATKLLGDLEYYLSDGTQVASFNRSLHALLNRNFSERYPNCTLDMFKRTFVEPAQLGPDYYYHMDMAHEMMRFDRGWCGPKGAAGGYKLELSLANENFSLVDAQIALFQAWKYLLLELSSCVSDPVLDRHMVHVAYQCLSANLEHSSSENIIVQISDSRASFALTLLQRAADSDALRTAAPSILNKLVDSINLMADPLNESSIDMYRMLLRALYVVLRSCGERSRRTHDVSVTQTVLVALDVVVGKGFRALVSAIHDGAAAASASAAASGTSAPATTTNGAPEDLALITAVLQVCLSMPGMDAEQTQILNILATHDVMHVACSLFSWADRLAVNGDPVYGELALQFLSELAKMAGIAEQMACDGVVSHLTSASMTNYLRRGAISPFAEDVAAERCYSIWAKGMLPLLLALLTAMGPTVAPEVAYVLNQFPQLLRSSVERLEAPGASRTASRDKVQFVALVGVMEAHSLALLTTILKGMRAAGARDIAEVEWDAAGLLEHIEGWLGSRRLLRERLVALNNREASWRGEKLKEGDEVSRLENMVVEEMEEIRGILADTE